MSDPEKERDKSKSSIPGMPDQAGDSVIPTSGYEAFRVPGTYISSEQSFGGTIFDQDRLYYSLRDPVGYWWIIRVANDIWDNWFKIVDVNDHDDESLNDAVQVILEKLKAKIQLPRETVFERRYGTSILLLSYTGFNNSWETPLFELNKDGEPPKTLQNSVNLLQITPHPWSQVETVELDTNESSLRYGMPETYLVTLGSSNQNPNTLPSGQTTTHQEKIHWTRVIHDAPRLDEHPFIGVSAIDIIFDDLVGGRNSKWGMYQGYYRHGQGFPVFTTLGSKAENEAWVAAGGVEDVLNARGYFIKSPEEDVEFKGAQLVALDPTQYFDAYFTFISAATGVAKDTIRGVSAGRVTGSEVNERQYFKSITLQQHKKEPLLRELIDRLIQTGQVEFDGEYDVEWIDPFEVNPQDKAAMDFMEARTRDLKLSYMTINEIRDIEKLPPREDGDIIVGRAGAVNPFNLKQPTPTEAKPEESEKTESELFDRAKKVIENE